MRKTRERQEKATQDKTRERQEKATQEKIIRDENNEPILPWYKFSTERLRKRREE